jgi:hypothetical protein
MLRGAPGCLAISLMLLSLTAAAQDSTPPRPGMVWDGVGSDLDDQPTDAFFQASWTDFEDPESQPVNYEAAIGTAPDCANVEPFRSVAQNKTAMWGVASGTLRKPLTRGAKYFVTVKATNNEGLSTRASSDGIVVAFEDGSLPPPTDGGVPSCQEPPDAGVPDGGPSDAGPALDDTPDGSIPEEREAPLGWGCGTLGGIAPFGLLALWMLVFLRSPSRR